MPRTPLKQGRNGTKSINAAIADLNAKTAPATTTVAGIVKQGAAVANATDAASAITQINALISSLEAAGVIVTV